MEIKKPSAVTIMAILIAGMISSGATLGLALVMPTISFSNAGTVLVADMGLYKMDGITPLTQIAWGDVSPPTTIYYEALLRNEGNIQLLINATSLSSSYGSLLGISLGWNVTSNNIMDPGDILHIKFSLQVDETAAKGAFTFTSQIKAFPAS